MFTTAVSDPITKRMSASEYFAAPGLSNSGMKDLEVSPLRYWHLYINPNRPEHKETPALRFGSALHCAVLEPEQFNNRYAKAVIVEDYPDCLRTMDDLRQWLRCKSLPTTGKTKLELIQRVQAADPYVPILDVIEARHLEQSAGKTILPVDEYERVMEAAYVLRDEECLKPILANGKAEVPMFGTDSETGITLKARMDWVTPTETLDLKTFSQTRGKSIDKTVNDAIYYEQYYRQAYLYTLIRRMQPGAKKTSFIIAFVESESPYEVRLKRLEATCDGHANLYWEQARGDVRRLIRTYADYQNKYGDSPWLDTQRIEPLTDEDMKQMAWV